MRLYAAAFRGTLLVIVLTAGCARAVPTAPTPGPVPQTPAIDAPAPPTRAFDASGTLRSRDGALIHYRSDGQPSGPRPTVIVLALSAHESLHAPMPYGRIADPLIADGWLAMSVDMPGHGEFALGDHPPLDAWRRIFGPNDDLVTGFRLRLSAALDTLVDQGFTDPARISLVGISRGAFLGLHTAVTDPRIAAAVALIPVTDLGALEEFAGIAYTPAVQAVALHRQAAPLARIRLWVNIGAADNRVSTERCIEFVEAVRAHGGNVVLQITGEAGHNYSRQTEVGAAEWLSEQP